MNPFNTFGLDVFTYLKHIGVQIKGKKITDKTASVFFLLFWQNTGQKKPVNEPSPLQRMMLTNPNVGLVNDNVYTKFDYILSIHSQDMEQNTHFGVNQRP